VGEPARGGVVARVAREDGAIDADRILIASEGRQVAREVDLDPLVDLAGAAVRRVARDERAEGVGVGLLVARGRVRGRRGTLVQEDAAPFAGGVGSGVAATARGHEERKKEEEAAHACRQSSTRALRYNPRRSGDQGQPTATGGFMAVRGEEVASSIEAHVRESIERMVSETRASIEDGRGVVALQLTAAQRRVPPDVNSLH